jgi:hypothetical protein
MELLEPCVRGASRVKYPFNKQVMEAIRISYQLAEEQMDHAKLCTMYVLLICIENRFTLQFSLDVLRGVIEAAAKVKDQETAKTTAENLKKFVCCLKEESMLNRCTSHLPR